MKPEPDVTSPAAPKPTGSAGRVVLLERLLALLLVAAISIGIYLGREHILALTRFGYAGIFMITLTANATVMLPVPGVPVVFAISGVLNPFWVGIAAGVGAALGELSGYLAGYSGRAVVEKVKYYEVIHGWMERHPRLSYAGIVVMAFIPNPFFDLAGIAAGSMRMPVTGFLFFCGIGSILKMLVVAYAGSTSLGWVQTFFAR